MQERTKKTNFFKEFFKSIKDLDKYEDFALKLPKDTFKYFLKLVLIFTLIITAFYTYKIIDNAKDIYSHLKEVLPDFSYSAGELNIDSEEAVIIDDYKEEFGKIIIDTEITENEIEKYKDEVKGSSLNILLLKNKCTVISSGTMGQVSYKYSELSENYHITELNKKELINTIENTNILSIIATVYFMMFIYIFIIYFISILIDVLILSLLAYIVARFSRIKLKYAPAFNIAVHSITLSVSLNLIYIIVNLLTGFTVKYFELMYSTISYIYVIVAVLMIKTDFINRQIELMKIAKEQEKIKEELKKEKEDKKEEQKDDNPDKKKKDKKEKNKEDEGKIEGEVNPSAIKEGK